MSSMTFISLFESAIYSTVLPPTYVRSLSVCPSVVLRNPGPPPLMAARIHLHNPHLQTRLPNLPSMHTVRRRLRLSANNTAAATLPPVQIRNQGPLAGIATPVVDPNDGSIRIMPPPEWIFASDNAGGMHAGTAPSASNGAPNAYAVHAFPALASPSSPSSYPPYSPLQNLAQHAHHQQQQSPNLQSPSQNYVFSPAQSSGSGLQRWSCRRHR